jgi:hypothetical protein
MDTAELFESETPQVGIGGLAELAPDLPSMRVGSGGEASRRAPLGADPSGSHFPKCDSGSASLG